MVRVDTDRSEDEYLNDATAYLRYRYLISLEDLYGTKFGTIFDACLKRKDKK